MDSIRSLDLKENDIASRAKRNDQLSGERASICFAAAKWADSQELACLPYRLKRFCWIIKITSRTVQLTLQCEVKQSFEILFGLTAENDLVRHF